MLVALSISKDQQAREVMEEYFESNRALEELLGFSLSPFLQKLVPQFFDPISLLGWGQALPSFRTKSVDCGFCELKLIHAYVRSHVEFLYQIFLQHLLVEVESLEFVESALGHEGFEEAPLPPDESPNNLLVDFVLPVKFFKVGIKQFLLHLV